MAGKNGNGHNHDEDEAIGNLPELRSNSEGSLISETEKEQLKALLGEGTVDKAFKTTDQMNALRMLIMSDPEILDNAMRYHIRGGYRYVVAMASLIAKCKENNYTQGEEELKLILGFTVSINGEGRKLFSDTIIGERKNFGNQESGGFQGIADKIKKAAFGT
jgi:hypothetical protein